MVAAPEPNPMASRRSGLPSSMVKELLQIDYHPPRRDWRDPAVQFRKGVFCYSAPPKHLEYLGLPNPRKWQPTEKDWKLPPNWKQIILEGMRERLAKNRAFRLF